MEHFTAHSAFDVENGACLDDQLAGVDFAFYACGFVQCEGLLDVEFAFNAAFDEGFGTLHLSFDGTLGADNEFALALEGADKHAIDTDVAGGVDFAFYGGTFDNDVECAIGRDGW